MKEKEEKGWGGAEEGGPGDYCTRPSVEAEEGYRGTFEAKNGFLPQKCPKNPLRLGWGDFGAVGVLPHDVIPQAIPQISPQILSLSPLYYKSTLTAVVTKSC